MFTNRGSVILLLAVVVFASTFLFASCNRRRVEKGDVYQRVSKDIHTGATKSEVINYLDSLEVNNIKASRGDYVKDKSNIPLTDHNGKQVEVDGAVGATFQNSWSFPNFCPSVGVIFYFDKSERLITYIIDCFG